MVRHQTLLRRCAWLALVTVVLLTGQEAAGSITRGLRAPPLDAADGQTLAALRGRAVLIEFFGTRCLHCQRFAPRMNELHARYGPRGLFVWGVSPDADAAIDAYRREYGVRHATSRVPMDALREYDVPKYPALLLLSPTGRVMWRGEPERLTDRVLDAYLGMVKVLPEAPPGQAVIVGMLTAGRYGEVEAQLARLRSCTAVDRVTCSFLLATLAWIDWQRSQTFDAAERDLDRGRPHSAWETYRELETEYAGTPHGQRAHDRRAALRADPALALVIDAEEALAHARRGGRWQTDASAAARLDLVARAHAGTRAAEEAARLAAMLRGGS